MSKTTRLLTATAGLLAATALIAIGVIVNLFSAQRFMRLVGELNRGQLAHRSLSKQGVIVALLLAVLGIAVAIYMIAVVA